MQRRRILLGVLCTFTGFLISGWAQAASLKSEAGPFIPTENEFASAVVIIPKTHQIVYSFKPNMPRVPASLTKLAGALAFMSVNPHLDRIVSIQRSDEVGGGRLRVNYGTKMTERDMLFSSITASANNAATALARISGLGKKNFYKRMNAQAKAAGATHSVFYDASGMEAKNRSSAFDIALIADKAFHQPVIQQAASMASYSFPLLNRGETKVIKNTNHLLTQDSDVYVIGGKTGYLPESKYNLVVELRPIEDGIGNRQKELIVVVMGSPSNDAMFVTAKRLAQWAWENHEF